MKLSRWFFLVSLASAFSFFEHDNKKLKPNEAVTTRSLVILTSSLLQKNNLDQDLLTICVDIIMYGRVNGTLI